MNILKTELLDLDPNSPTAAKERKYWLRTFNNLIAECGNGAQDKYQTIINLMTHNVFDYVEDCVDFDSVVKILQNLYIKTSNDLLIDAITKSVYKDS